MRNIIRPFGVFKHLLILLVLLCYAAGDYYDNILERAKENSIKWCTVGIEEYKKCDTWSKAVQRDIVSFGSDYLDLKCVNGTGKDDCMHLIEEEKATMTTLDAGEVFTGGRFFSTVPLLQHLYEGSVPSYYAVAVIKRGTLTEVTNLRHLRGKKACFTGVGRLAGWVLPIDVLMRRGGLEIIDCNNHVKNAVAFFGPSCAVDSLADKYNPIGDNSDKLCQLCAGRAPGQRCTGSDPYVGFTGAFRCLLEAGEIAFLKHTIVADLLINKLEFPSVTKEDFELLCVDGTRRPVDDYMTCNWGMVPSPAVVTSSAKTAKTRRMYQRFLQRSVTLYGKQGVIDTSTVRPTQQDSFYRQGNGMGNEDRWRQQQGGQQSTQSYDQQQPNNRGRDRDFENQFTNNYDYNNSGLVTNKTYNYFNLFESYPRYGEQHNLLFEDNTELLKALPENQQTFSAYLVDTLDVILRIRDCPVRTMTLCVTSDPEMEKCLKMRTALKAQLMLPEMSCYKGHSHIHCMQAIRNGDADVANFDAGDIYTGGLRYDLIPIMAEVYNLPTPEYYVVAVAKEEDPSTEITYLKSKNTCHGGVNTAAGWVVPMAYLISNGWMRSYGCNAMRAAAEYFSKACAPGALSLEYNSELPYDNMCHLCHGRSYSYCRRDASEDYYGHTGAFRCLVEGGGDVAFVKHTTVLENTDGKRKEWWARNTLNEDYQLLCPDGTRSTLDRFRECNLGKVSSNAIVTRGGEAYNHTEVTAFINLFIYAQQFYGRKDQDDFNFAMFYSEPPYADLIFQDATTQMIVVPSNKRWYWEYVGKDFMRAKRIVDCHAGVDLIRFSISLISLPFLVYYLQNV